MKTFDITNPNRVRSLIGGFIDNTSQFHKIDGSGYKFLTSIIVKIVLLIHKWHQDL